jgi:hypothetical protein
MAALLRVIAVIQSAIAETVPRARTRFTPKRGTSGRGEVNRLAVHAGRFISAVSQPNRFAKVRDLGVTVYI